MTINERTPDEARAGGMAARDSARNRTYRATTRNAAMRRARRIAAAFEGYEAEAIANGDLDQRTLDVAAMDLE